MTNALVAVGWQRQVGPHAFPPTRPMLRAAIEAGGRIFRSHLHIVPSGSPELGETLAFRDALRDDPALRAAYVVRKRAILESGITEGVAYARAKGGFVEETLKALRSR